MTEPDYISQYLKTSDNNLQHPKYLTISNNKEYHQIILDKFPKYPTISDSIWQYLMVSNNI